MKKLRRPKGVIYSKKHLSMDEYLEFCIACIKRNRHKKVARLTPVNVPFHL